MYACQGKFPDIPKLDEFSISADKSDTASRMMSGEKIVLRKNPRIRITVSGSAGKKDGKAMVQVRLIRSGTIIQTFKGTLPLVIDYTDLLEKPGEKVYYRMDMTGFGKIVSNPIFVEFAR
jgi:hypothetical protein